MDQSIVDNYRDLVIIKENDFLDASKNAPEFPSSEQEPICTSITKVCSTILAFLSLLPLYLVVSSISLLCKSKR
jgi:hypothetical protein